VYRYSEAVFLKIERRSTTSSAAVQKLRLRQQPVPATAYMGTADGPFQGCNNPEIRLYILILYTFPLTRAGVARAHVMYNIITVLACNTAVRYLSTRG